MQFSRFYLLVLALALAVATGAQEERAETQEGGAETQEESAEARGLAIALEGDRRDTGFGDFKVELTMVLRNKHGDEAERSMRSRTLEQDDDGDKAIIIFDTPGDVKGTAFLSFTHKEGDDDQWLYLPSLTRVKRISSSNKSGPFMGSEFAYEDISSQEVEKYSFKYLRDETYEGRDHFIVERDPVDPKSGYTRQVVWVDKEHYRVAKVDFYDLKDALVKTLTMKGYQQYLDQYWRADTWHMENHQTGKSTELIWNGYEFGNGFVDGDFNTTSLKRAR
ncbi:MAG: outer membrane lipoprotein-sorting protein [Candidatus Latescibacteria bacterium]|nr:outer membrane lipoprotein-sorting protein [Candidatus Latescibacterota bacterium]